MRTDKVRGWSYRMMELKKGEVDEEWVEPGGGLSEGGHEAQKEGRATLENIDSRWFGLATLTQYNPVQSSLIQSGPV